MWAQNKRDQPNNQRTFTWLYVKNNRVVTKKNKYLPTKFCTMQPCVTIVWIVSKHHVMPSHEEKERILQASKDENCLRPWPGVWIFNLNLYNKKYRLVLNRNVLPCIVKKYQQKNKNRNKGKLEKLGFSYISIKQKKQQKKQQNCKKSLTKNQLCYRKKN